MRLLLLCCAVLALAACNKPVSQETDQSAAAAQAGPVKGVDRSHKGKPFPDVAFRELEHDSEMTYEALRGVPTLVNLWATWCAPCVKELPSLNALARQRMADLAVIPISQDTAPPASVNAFLDRLSVDALGRYQDPKMALSGALGAEVLPTTILYDAQGREVWRYVGDLDWTGAEAARLLAEAKPGGKA
jgi:thiol-disulfide isomerase/thioredoxin